MHILRAVYRLIFFVLITGAVILFFSVGLIFCGFSKTKRIRWKNRIISFWASVVSSLIGLRIKIKGEPPKPPFFMVSNHLSYIDILPFWKHLETTFIAKSEIRNWPLFGQAARLLGIIFINREMRSDVNRVNGIIRETLAMQEGIILFPEGTSTKGKKVLPFKSSLLHFSAAEGMPVYFASIRYGIDGESSKKAWRDICWWGDMDFLSHFWRLLQIKSWSATVEFGAEPVTAKDRKQLARELQQSVTKIFVPTA